jgi:hypothetical protein
MSTAVLDPKLQHLATQIESAFLGGPAPSYKDYSNAGSVTTRDAATVAGSLLAAYHTAATINPAKAYRAKGYRPNVALANSTEASSKEFWDSVWSIVQTCGPIVVDALDKQFQPAAKNLSTIIQSVPNNRRNDKAWVDYTTSTLMTLAQGAVQSLSGQKDLSDPASRPQMPSVPIGADKSFFDDAFSFVSDAAPVALPIIMSLL